MPQFDVHSSIESIGADAWQRLCLTTESVSNPFINYHFLHALEKHRCVGADAGWAPQHIRLLDSDGHTAGVLPIYLKNHSQGEFVFDWNWARAAQNAGIDYYPKLVTSIPFTPVTGSRMGLAEGQSATDLLLAVKQLAEDTQTSSWHLLFPDQNTVNLLHTASQALEGMELLERRDCHFVWNNNGYQSFDDFLQSFSSRKRKNLKKERRRVAEQGVELKRWEGADVSDALMQAFYRFYEVTYHRRGQHPYLSLSFFQQLRLSLPGNLLLVTAEQDQQLVGAALFMKDERSLYGRWWGGRSDIDCLHFEACYYQGIEYAIEHKLERFDPGIQGEHKLLRGFEPEQTRSLHWIRNPALAHGIARWLATERHYVDDYQQQAQGHLPYRQEPR